MIISQDLIAKAKEIVLAGLLTDLPVPIAIGGAEPIFVVGNVDDESIIAHATIGCEGKIYKIGTLVKV